MGTLRPGTLGGTRAESAPSGESALQEESMELRKGMRVRELTKKVGQVPRLGTVLGVRGHTVEIRWDGGQISSLAHGLLFPIPEKKAD